MNLRIADSFLFLFDELEVGENYFDVGDVGFAVGELLTMEVSMFTAFMNVDGCCVRGVC